MPRFRRPLRISRTALSLLAVVAAAAACVARPAGAAILPITEFPLPSASAAPDSITTGPDGNVWFLELGSSNVARITPGGTVTEFPVSANSLNTEARPVITSGPDGNLWFTEVAGNTIARITPTGTLHQFALPEALDQPIGITAGPDGNLWFTEYQGNRIGRITPAGAIAAEALTTGSDPAGITRGPDGALWFAQEGTGQIGRITTGGAISQFNGAADAVQIVAGADGNLWFTTLFNAAVYRLTPSGTLTPFTLSASAYGIALGPDGNVWFTEPSANQIGSITPAGVVHEYQVPTTNASPANITAGPDGDLWFSELNTGNIGRATPPCTPTATTLCIDDQPGDQRWQADISYSTAQGGGLAGSGNAIQLSSLGLTDGGLFWFFSADNPEMLVKVLNGCAVDQQYWVFASAGTNVGYTLTIKDTHLPSSTKSYTNADGTAAVPVQDTAAFPCLNVDLAPAAGAPPAMPTGAVPAPPPAAAPAAAPAPAAAVDQAACAADASTLCIDSRFQVRVSYDAGNNNSGNGHAISLQSLGVAQGGLFWFFGATNPEMLIKVLNGCAVDNHYWVFYSAGTNVAFQVSVIDTQTSAQRTYSNTDGVAAPPVQDTGAFACP